MMLRLLTYQASSSSAGQAPLASAPGTAFASAPTAAMAADVYMASDAALLQYQASLNAVPPPFTSAPPSVSPDLGTEAAFAQARDMLAQTLSALQEQSAPTTPAVAAPPAEQAPAAAASKPKPEPKTDKAAPEKAADRPQPAHKPEPAKPKHKAETSKSKPSGGKWADPVQGHVSSPFGMRTHPITGQRKLHTGMDIAAPSGTPVKAPADGRVSFAGYNSVNGNYVVIKHGEGRSTLYAHLASSSVHAGEQVEAGDVIGKVGSTGMSTGPHLHFEVQENGRPVNPATYLA